MKTIKRKTPETQEWPADKTERRDISTLIPYARNARTHSETQVKQIAASMTEWGFTVPVLIDALDVDELNVRINSGGGLVFEGIAIYNAIALEIRQRNPYY